MLHQKLLSIKVPKIKAADVEMISAPLSVLLSS